MFPALFFQHCLKIFQAFFRCDDLHASLYDDDDNDDDNGGDGNDDDSNGWLDDNGDDDGDDDLYIFIGNSCSLSLSKRLTTQDDPKSEGICVEVNIAFCV